MLDISVNEGESCCIEVDQSPREVRSSGSWSLIQIKYGDSHSPHTFPSWRSAEASYAQRIAPNNPAAHSRSSQHGAIAQRARGGAGAVSVQENRGFRGSFQDHGLYLQFSGTPAPSTRGSDI